jgi:hypothetical protein
VVKLVNTFDLKLLIFYSVVKGDWSWDVGCWDVGCWDVGCWDVGCWIE